jgi:excisionase family DNA binding protein
MTTVQVHAELTVEEAADVLNVSGSYLVTLLDSEQIPSRRAGADRRILAVDLLAYKEKDDAQRRGFLDQLTEEAEKHGLGY